MNISKWNIILGFPIKWSLSRLNQIYVCYSFDSCVKWNWDILHQNMFHPLHSMPWHRPGTVGLVIHKPWIHRPWHSFFFETGEESEEMKLGPQEANSAWLSAVQTAWRKGEQSEKSNKETIAGVMRHLDSRECLQRVYCWATVRQKPATRRYCQRQKEKSTEDMRREPGRKSLRK